MSDCEKLSKDISAYLDGALPQDRIEAVECHLAECAACRRMVEEFRAADAAARDVPMPDEARWQAVWERIEAETRAQSARPLLLSYAWKGATWLAVAAALLVAIYVIGPRDGRRGGTLGAGAGFEVISIEVNAPGYTPVIMTGGGGQLPVVWLERNNGESVAPSARAG